MALIAAIIESLCSALFVPLASYPTVAMTIAAAILGTVCALLYGKISPQKQLKGVKRGITAQFLRVLVFRRDLKTMLAAQLALLFGGVKYLLVSVPPIAVLLFPMLLILSEMNLWLGYRPAAPGEGVIIEAQLTALQARAISSATLAAASNEALVSAPVRQAKSGLGTWRVTAGPQDTTLELNSTSYPVKIPLSVSKDAGLRRIAPSFSNDFWAQILVPTRTELPASFSQVTIDMPLREINFAGWHTTWLIPFFILTIAFGYLAARLAKIEV